MSFVVYVKNANGSTYAYEAFSYRDPVSKAPKQKRVYLGKVDSETNTIIPKKVRKESIADDLNSGTAGNDTPGHSSSGNNQSEADQTTADMIARLQQENQILISAFNQIAMIASNASRELKNIDQTSAH